MRRIYESRALSRDDEDPFKPGDRDEYTPQAARSIDAGAWSDRILPHSLRCRSVAVRVSVPRTEFAVGETIPFTVHMHNPMPVPLTIRTASPVLWRWCIDGLTEASHVPLREPPDRAGRFRFERGEHKRFRKDWSQRFRVSDREWTAADPGTYTLRAEVNVADPDATGLADEATIDIVT